MWSRFCTCIVKQFALGFYYLQMCRARFANTNENTHKMASHISHGSWQQSFTFSVKAVQMCRTGFVIIIHIICKHEAQTTVLAECLQICRAYFVIPNFYETLYVAINKHLGGKKHAKVWVRNCCNCKPMVVTVSVRLFTSQSEEKIAHRFVLAI